MAEAFEYIRLGGWPMIPLAACSFAALTVIIERLYALRRARVLDPYLLDAVDTYRGEPGTETLLSACERSNGALARIIEDIIEARKLDRAHLMETMQSSGRREVGNLERGLIVLEIVAGISPLLGLLGTVLGMVTVFDAITAQGMGNPQVLSDGISKALITTVAGLCVAIPALAFHSVFSRRVEAMALEMQDAATAFIVRMLTNETSTPEA